MSQIGYQREKAARDHGLKFYPSSHRYKLDGAWVTGVTTLLGVLDKPAIPKWAAKSVAEYVANNREGVEHLYGMGQGPMVQALKDVPWQQRDEAANRGTEVHDFAERIARGEEVDVPDLLVGHVESCLAFLDEWDIKPVLIEQCVGSRQYKYAGKLDLVADHNQGPRAIFDYKTSKSGIYANTAFQLVAYGMAEFYGENGEETPMSEVGIEASYGVHIRADGYDVLPLKYGEQVYDEFLCIARAYHINKRANGDWKVPGSGYVGLVHEINDHMGETA